MNVTELARRLKVTTNELLEKLPELGFAIGKRAIKVDDRLVNKITMAWSEHKRREQMAAEEANVTEIRLDAKKSEQKLDKIIQIGDTIIIRDLADIMKVPINKLMVELMKNGIMATLNQAIDYETAVIIGEDLGFKVDKINNEEMESSQYAQQESKIKDIIKERSGTITRPPVVIVMGHVDHGKTKLLDALRETNVVAQEAGGITQHIGAYQVQLRDHLITFLDTPGHEAFKAMRSRGSKIADVAIIVVAADDGLQPQTIEVITLCQRENIPFIIAINKIDKEEADIDRVKKELSEINLIPEDWGGKTICVPISAKENTNLDHLLEMVLLLSDLADLKADEDGSAAGTIVEAHKNKNEGPVATVLIQTGILRVGDSIVVGSVTGKVKAIKNEYGQELALAGPSKPVRILGLKETPIIGDILEVIADQKIIKQKQKEIRYQKTVSTNNNVVSSSSDGEKESLVPTLPLILKTDVMGSQEAIMEALSKLNTAHAQVKIIKKGLGYVTDVDVMDAENAKAMLIGFNSKPQKSAEQLSIDKKIKIHLYSIIYNLLDDVKLELDKIKAQQTLRIEMGEIKVLAVFKSARDHMIIGGEVVKGKVQTNTKIKVTREQEIIDFGMLEELQASKMIVSEVVVGQQCGLKYKGRPLIQVGDILEIYQEKIS
ncbi:MAG: translation initiation factor IF-2 [Candidatus Komeilibacteria bacterium CG_4_10_14_0_2_um_filter_37_10]|uniref:Translation initiation factor IF-2 n=1 Tax=Candidatus Komeilibacteria bacterium CG_4_10_14_0_2_um_filter_37_10 TaxID=1974470 RepID=A0A2M7VGW2_9BACT|nr:MAG: translation initiation factor IF-2 [Candidatus Komeilibacteria bacterium CG_4_10_14_0_2_um_filter_37_10]